MIISKAIFTDQDGVTSNTNGAAQSMDGLPQTRARRLCFRRQASAVERRILTYSEIMPVNNRFRRETSAGFRSLVPPPSHHGVSGFVLRIYRVWQLNALQAISKPPLFAL
jgi:hypothetical protein